VKTALGTLVSQKWNYCCWRGARRSFYLSARSRRSSSLLGPRTLTHAAAFAPWLCVMHTDQCIQESDASRLSKSFLMISLAACGCIFTPSIFYSLCQLEATLVSDATVDGHYFICRAFKTISTPACVKLWTASAAHVFLRLYKSGTKL
jgi:hypothetical protein